MVEQYTPTSSERENALARGDFLKVSGDGVFATLQGEGVTAGNRAVFLRLQNCNLHCGGNEQGWLCDAWYTWDRTTPEYWQELVNTPINEAASLVKATWEASFGDSSDKRLVITGGEPLLQQRKIIKLLPLFSDWNIEIETNGTIVPHEDLQNCQFNCSPKLASSGNSVGARFRQNALNIIAGFPNSWFKFVVVDDKDLEEIQTVMESTSITYNRVLLMSEGTDEATLHGRDQWLARVATELGCGFTARNQIFWFGNKRAT